MQVEVDFDGDLYRNGSMPVPFSRFELPLTDCAYSLLVQSSAQRVEDLYISRVSLVIHN